MELPVVNHPDYEAKIGDDNKFPIKKFGELANFLKKEKVVKKFYKPEPCSIDTLKEVHSEEYIYKIKNMIEKPKVKDAPSNLASIGRYVLTSDIFDILRDISTGSGGEIQLADAINIQAKRGSVNTVPIKGKRFDCGSVNGFVEATNFEFKKFTAS